MDYISLFITIIGILALIGLYFMSKRYGQTPSSNKKMTISMHTDSRGKQLSSVMADIPASDGSTPTVTATQKKAPPEAPAKTLEQEAVTEKVQLILFISAKDTEKELDGNLILQAMGKLDCHFGEMDIFHYLLERESLFRVANGVAPWTLIPDDIKNTTTPGLSLIMEAPTSFDGVDDSKLLTFFIETAKKLAEIIHGEVRNIQQEAFSDDDETTMREMLP
jgi:cell division protein ZipA